MQLFLASEAQMPELQRKPASYNLLWAAERAGCPLDDPADHSWLKDVYSLRQAGSEFVSAKRLCLADDDVTPQLTGVVNGEAAEHPQAAASRVPIGADLRGKSASLWVAGPGALAMEKRSSTEIVADVEQLLNAFPPVREALPVAAHVYRTTWGSDPLFRGSYSFVSAASSVRDMELLGRPVMRHAGQPVLFFAGEATHNSHYGTTHGAFLTGRREAINVLRGFGMPF